MKLLIVDDERIARSELKFLIKELNQSVQILEADSVESALSILREIELDGAFIDMQLPDGIGMEIAQAVMSRPNGAFPIVFATAFERYSLDAFSVEAVDYVMKPFRSEDIARAMQRMSRIKPKNEILSCPTDKISVNTHEKVVVLNLQEIAYITALERHSVVHTLKAEYTTHLSLDRLEERLMNCGFMRVQRSYIVNLNMVNEFIPWFNNGYGLKLMGFNQKVIPISRNKVGLLKEIFEF